MLGPFALCRAVFVLVSAIPIVEVDDTQEGLQGRALRLGLGELRGISPWCLCSCHGDEGAQIPRWGLRVLRPLGLPRLAGTQRAELDSVLALSPSPGPRALSLSNPDLGKLL